MGLTGTLWLRNHESFKITHFYWSRYLDLISPGCWYANISNFFNLQLLIKMDADYSIYKVYDYSTITVMTQFSTTL